MPSDNDTANFLMIDETDHGGESRWVFEGEEQGGAINGCDPAEEAYNDDYDPIFEDNEVIEHKHAEQERKIRVIEDLWCRAAYSAKRAFEDFSRYVQNDEELKVDPGTENSRRSPLFLMLV